MPLFKEEHEAKRRCEVALARPHVARGSGTMHKTVLYLPRDSDCRPTTCPNAHLSLERPASQEMLARSTVSDGQVYDGSCTTVWR